VTGLRRVDRVLEIGCWLTAGLLVVMLLFGPAVIAHDKAQGGAAAAGSAMYGGGAGANGAKVFKDNCGSCHTLSTAGTTGQIGPNLDNTTLSVPDIEATVRNGRGGMPAFGDSLSDAQIKAVAAYVDASR
jgi:mono/diheme cytochrome c family protein